MTRKEQAERRATIAADVLAGMASSDAARKHGVSVQTVSAACIEHGTPLPANNRRPIRSFDVLKRLLAGEKQSALAAEYNVTRQAINCIAVAAREAGFAV